MSDALQTTEAQGLIVVGVCASAGGVEAVERLFGRIDPNCNLAFVVLQHLDPQRPSLLPDLLAKKTSLAVHQAENDLQVEPNHVYVIEPGTVLTLEKGRLRARRSTDPHASSTLIDTFLRSLAEDQREHAIAVVLSGAGSDGTAGALAVKRLGGLVLAQSPESAGFDSMPRNVIATGIVDSVLAPEEMSAKLGDWVGRLEDSSREADSAAEILERLDAICEAVRQRTGHDFSRYKHGTLLRRIRRRLLVRQVPSVGEYLEVLGEDGEEAQALLKDLLIGVTQFFRDPEVFDALAANVIPQVFAEKTGEFPVRLWIPGCASGEEAYTVAILLQEHMRRNTSVRPVHIFATDIDEDLLQVARKGRYSPRIAEHLSPERLERFFTPVEDGYQAMSELRSMCVFSSHNLLRDPPFSSLDLICCRNLLIYLEADLQKKLMPLFHYALRSGGYLLLGPSEGLAGHPELFRVVDKKQRIFQRNDAAENLAMSFPLADTRWRRASSPGALPRAGASQQETQQGAGHAFERMILEQYSPAAVMVNEQGDILYFSGPTNRFLRHPLGTTSINLFDLAHENLRLELRAAVHKVVKSRQVHVREGISVEVGDEPRPVTLTVRPMSELGYDCGLLAVVFQEQGVSPATPPPDVEAGTPAERSIIQHLEGELRIAREDLQVAVEELESANEELRSSNEELITTNEELQSANEELQTSKEELQSTNEELETVNAELSRRVTELDVANSDLQNYFASTQIATLFLDRAMNIQKFTPAAAALFHFLDTDVGRPIADLTPRFVGVDLIADIERVVQSLAVSEKQAQAADDHSWFMIRIIPYRTVDHVIAGVVVNFVDITRLKRAEICLRQMEQRFSTTFHACPGCYVRRGVLRRPGDRHQPGRTRGSGVHS